MAGLVPSIRETIADFQKRPSENSRYIAELQQVATILEVGEVALRRCGRSNSDPLAIVNLSLRIKHKDVPPSGSVTAGPAPLASI